MPFLFVRTTKPSPSLGRKPTTAGRGHEPEVHVPGLSPLTTPTGTVILEDGDAVKKRFVPLIGALALSLLAARLPVPAAAPREPSPPASRPDPPPQGQDPAKSLQYEYAVVLKLIQVHVTDKKGNPVRDLTKDDFIVTDNGQRMTVTEFETHALHLPAEEAAAPDAPPPGPAAPEARPSGRKIFLFFDFAYNNARGIVKARTAALHLLDAFVRPEDRVAVMTYSGVGGLAFHEYLTTDHAKARQVIEKIGHGDVKGRATQIEDQYWRLVQSTGGPFALGFRAEAEGNRQESKSMAQKYMLTLTGLARALRLVDGQKDFILFSTGSRTRWSTATPPTTPDTGPTWGAPRATTSSGARTRRCTRSSAPPAAPSTPSTRANTPRRLLCSPMTSRPWPWAAGP